MEVNERQFKGVWIEAEIWEATDLTWMEKCLLAEINCLDHKERGCTASNEYLAAVFQSTVPSIKNMLSRLRSGGYLITESFTGRKRCMRVFRDRVVGSLGSYPRGNQVVTPEVTASLPLTVVPYIRERKEEKKGAPEGAPADVEKFPPHLDTAEFRAAWDDWYQFRKEKRSRLVASTVKMQLAKLRKYSCEVAVQMIHQSIEQGWIGLFPLRTRSGRAVPEDNSAEQQRLGRLLNAAHAAGDTAEVSRIESQIYRL